MCKCSDTWDVRCCCDGVKGDFKNCPMRINTGYCIIENDPDVYDSIIKKLNDYRHSPESMHILNIGWIVTKTLKELSHKDCHKIAKLIYNDWMNDEF